MNRRKPRFFLVVVLVILYILRYSPSRYHHGDDTRKAGIFKNAYRELEGDPVYLGRSVSASWEGSIPYLAQSLALTARALHSEWTPTHPLDLYACGGIITKITFRSYFIGGILYR